MFWITSRRPFREGEVSVAESQGVMRGVSSSQFVYHATALPKATSTRINSNLIKPFFKLSAVFCVCKAFSSELHMNP